MISPMKHFSGPLSHLLRSLTPARGLVFACVVSSLAIGTAAEAPIKPDEPRVQIRAEVLKATPPGVSPAAVLDYIRKTFERRDDAPAPQLASHPARGVAAEASGKAGVQSIRLVLGRYLRNPATFLMEIPIVTKTTTTVQWAFDKEGKLLEVFVDKDSELGDGGPDGR